MLRVDESAQIASFKCYQQPVNPMLDNLKEFGTRNLLAAKNIVKNAKLSKCNYIIVQVQGPLFTQFEQIAYAASLADKTRRRLAIDRSMYEFFKASPDVAQFLHENLELLDLSGFVFKRRDDPPLLKRADWRRGVKCLLAPTLLGYNELAAIPKRGSVVLHGFPTYNYGIGHAPDLSGIFRQHLVHHPYQSARAIFRGQLPHEKRVRIKSDATDADIYLTDTEFSLHFSSILGSRDILTNSKECVYWLRHLVGEESKVEFQA